MPTDLRTRPYALCANFHDTHALLLAARGARKMGLTHVDAFTPFPVHGLDEALGVPRSRLPFITLACGLSGAILIFALMYWTMSVDYPLNIGGKPFFAYPAYVPITFEVTVLFSAISTVLGMFYLTRTPSFYHPIDRDKFAGRITSDLFVFAIEYDDPLFEDDKVRAMLAEVGASDVRVVMDEEPA